MSEEEVRMLADKFLDDWAEAESNYRRRRRATVELHIVSNICEPLTADALREYLLKSIDDPEQRTPFDIARLFPEHYAKNSSLQLICEGRVWRAIISWFENQDVLRSLSESNGNKHLLKAVQRKHKGGINTISVLNYLKDIAAEVKAREVCHQEAVLVLPSENKPFEGETSNGKRKRMAHYREKAYQLWQQLEYQWCEEVERVGVPKYDEMRSPRTRRKEVAALREALNRKRRKG